MGVLFGIAVGALLFAVGAYTGVGFEGILIFAGGLVCGVLGMLAWIESNYRPFG